MDEFTRMVQDLIDTGHTIQIAPNGSRIADVQPVMVSVSGPTGSRGESAATAEAALARLVGKIVEARLLSNKLVPSATMTHEEVVASLERLGVVPRRSP